MDVTGYLRKAQFRLEVIADMLEDLDRTRLVGSVRAARQILLNTERALMEDRDD